MKNEPEFFDDEFQAQEPPEPDQGYSPLLTDLEGEFAANAYLAQSKRHHPEIEWPVKTPPRKKGDVTFAPSQKHIENTARMIDAYGISVRWNLMRHGLEITIPDFNPPAERAENATLAMLLALADRRGLKKEAVLDHALILARDYHPVRDWFNSKSWDGRTRLADFIGTLQMPGDESERQFAGTLITRWLVSCAAAVLPPVSGQRPFTPQGVLTLQGAQGKGKTEWFKSLAPSGSGWISAGFVLDPKDRDSVQQATSHWIVELGEVDATFKRSDASALKGFITKAEDVFRSAYARREERTPRRTVLGATVNRQSFLIDETGNRRWWAIPIEGVTWNHEIDMQQLWAEVAMMAMRGDPWWLTGDETATLGQSNRQFELSDPLIEDLWDTWQVVKLYPLQTPPRVGLAEIWSALPGREHKTRQRGDSAAISAALRDADAMNDTKTNGLATFRVERIRQATGYQQQDRWRDDNR